MNVLVPNLIAARTVDDQPQVVHGGVLLHVLHLDALHLGLGLLRGHLFGGFGRERHLRLGRHGSVRFGVGLMPT